MPEPVVTWDPLLPADPGPTSDGQPTPFANPWLVAGLQQIFRPDTDSRVATLRGSDTTVTARLALVLRNTRNGPVPVRQLEGGPRNQASLAELLADDVQAATLLLQGIRDQDDWDLMELRAVPADGLLAAASRQVGATVRADVPAHSIPLVKDVAILSTGRNRELRRLRRRMEESVGYVLATRTPTDPDWREVLQALTDLHVQRWRHTDTPSPFADAAVTDRFVNWFAAPPAGITPTATVIANDSSGVTGGVVLGLIGGGATHAWRMAYDPELRPYSPGIQLLTAMAESARQTGSERLELGRGAEPYKQSWNCIREERVVVRWHRRTAATRMIATLARIARRGGLKNWGAD